MNTRIFAPGVVEVFKPRLRVRVYRALIAAAFIGVAGAFGAASAWLIAGLL